MGQAGCVRHVFDIGERLGVGVSDARTAVLLAEADNLLGHELVVLHLLRIDIRDRYVS